MMINGGVAAFTTVMGSSDDKAVQGPAQPLGREQGRLQTRSALHRRFTGERWVGPTGDDPDTYTFVEATTGPLAVPSIRGGPIPFFGGGGAEMWFEKIHVYPGGPALNPGYDEGFKLEYGDILADIDRQYEIYWAGRRASTTLSTINLTTIDPGIETPEVSVSDTLGPGTSLLAAASTFNTDGVTGLGTPALVVMRALKDGVARFDGQAVFTFTLGSATIDASGNRVSMILVNYEFPFSESMHFLTDIITHTAGTEQRIALRKQPRERYNCTFRLDGLDRQRMRSLLFAWHNQTFGLPLFHEGTELTAASLALATQFQITQGNSTDFRVGGLAMVFTDALIFDIVEITAVTDTLLSIAGTADFAYPAGTRIMPVRTVRIVSQVKTKQFKFNNYEEFSIIFESLNNDTGTAAADTTLWGNMSTYDGKLLLDDCNLMGISMSTVMTRNITVLDNKTGAVEQQSEWATDKRNSVKGFMATSRSQIQDMKALFRGLRGKQVSFWLPTFTNDLTAGASLLSGSTNLDIENIDYRRFVDGAGPMSVFKITFDDDTSLLRVIQSAADHPTDETLERLTLDTTWPSSRALNEIVQIEFYEQVRFASDKFLIKHDRVGLARCQVPVTVVFD